MQARPDQPPTAHVDFLENRLTETYGHPTEHRRVELSFADLLRITGWPDEHNEEFCRLSYALLNVNRMPNNFNGVILRNIPASLWEKKAIQPGDKVIVDLYPEKPPVGEGRNHHSPTIGRKATARPARHPNPNRVDAA